jgi:hypothetical protein
MSLFDALAVLEKHGVEFVVIGAFSAVAQGYPLPTEDLDVTPSRDRTNLERLATALIDLEAELRLSGDQTHAFPSDADYLGRADSWMLTTTAGWLDIVFAPTGTNGYEDLRRDAVQATLRGTPVLLASLRDIIRMKEASAREKDRMQLPALRRTLEVRRRSDLE